MQVSLARVTAQALGAWLARANGSNRRWWGLHTGLCRVLSTLTFVPADLCDHALHIPHDEL